VKRRAFVLIGPALVALLAATAAYAPALYADRQLAGRDLLTLYYPLFRHVSAAWAGEASFQRDPLRGAGQAVLPDPLAAVCYPPGAACWAGLPFDPAFKLYFLLHTALLGAGAASLARALGASSRGACLAAVAGALAGPVLSACRTPNLLAATAWSGFVLSAFVQLRHGGVRARRAAAGAALGAALMILAGGAEILLLLALVVAVAVPAAARQPRRILRGYAAIGGATALGVLLASVHLVPFKLWLPETLRGTIASQGTIPLEEATRWSLHPLRLLETVVPVISPSTLAPWRPGFYESVYASFQPFGKPLHASVHLGLPVVILALLGARRSRRALGVALGGLVWLAIALRVGDSTPGWEALRALAPPLFGTWRYPVKTLLPLSVIVAALAGVGLRRVPEVKQVAVCVATCLLLVATPLVDRDVIPTLPLSAFQTPPGPAAKILAHEATRDGAPGRYLRLHRIESPPGAEFAEIRQAHLDELRENLPALHGIEGLLSYGPFANRRLDPYLLSIRRDAPEFFDRERLRQDACVAYVLDAEGLHTVEPAPRVQLEEGQGEVTLTRLEADRVEVRVDLRTPGRVYVAEGFDAAWRAWTLPEHPAAGAAARAPVALEEGRGLGIRAALPAGRYRLVLSYRARGVWTGLGLTLLGLVVVAGLWLRREPSAQT
jgi:hypothetical protein